MIKRNRIKYFINTIIFGSKWLLIPFYFGLILAQVLYCFKFCQAVVELFSHFRALDEPQVMLAILMLIDITMIANLLKMIITGSYQSFVEKNVEDHTEKVSSGLLKVKMATSLVGISAIHLLRVFITPEMTTNRDLIVKAGIHVIFLASALSLATIDYLHNKAEIYIKEESHN